MNILRKLVSPCINQLRFFHNSQFIQQHISKTSTPPLHQNQQQQTQPPTQQQPVVQTCDDFENREQKSESRTNPAQQSQKVPRNSFSNVFYQIANKNIDLFWGKVINNRFQPPFFNQGWGNLDVVEIEKEVDYFNQKFRSKENSFPLEIKWEHVKNGKTKTCEYEILDGTFVSPVSNHLLQHLPEISRVGYFRFIKPVSYEKSNGLVIHLAGTGEHGYTRRTNRALPLLENGVASIILESPFYGKRRPENQFGSKINYVSDLLVQGRVTIDETIHLVNLFKTQGVEKICLSGFSMGGVHAALAVSLIPFNVACAPLMAPHSAAEAFCFGTLWEATGLARRPCKFSHAVNFQSWHADINDVFVQGSEKETVRYRLAKALEVTNITKYPVPKKPEAAVIVAAEFDQYVSPMSVAKIHNHWKGSEIRYVIGGHVSSYLVYGNIFTKAILDSLKRLEV